MTGEQRTAIVTGAGSGIGAGIARRLHDDGYRLLLTDLEQKLADEVASELQGSITHSGDLSLPAAGEELVALAMDSWGRVDVLVNNAGGGIIRPTLEHTEETLQATIDRNLWTTIRCTLAVIPVMRDAGYGRVVCIGADSVRNGVPGHAIYNAAKGGVHAMNRGFAREFATDGITFNTVAPSMVATPEVMAMQAQQPDFFKPFLAVIPMGRPASVEEVASMVAYLASPEAGFVTGQVIAVNGGANFLG